MLFYPSGQLTEQSGHDCANLLFVLAAENERTRRRIQRWTHQYNLCWWRKVAFWLRSKRGCGQGAQTVRPSALPTALPLSLSELHIILIIMYIDYYSRYWLLATREGDFIPNGTDNLHSPTSRSACSATYALDFAACCHTQAERPRLKNLKRLTPYMFRLGGQVDQMCVRGWITNQTFVKSE